MQHTHQEKRTEIASEARITDRSVFVDLQPVLLCHELPLIGTVDAHVEEHWLANLCKKANNQRFLTEPPLHTLLHT